MGPFLLVLLSLNPRTGDYISSTVVGDPYQSIGECMQAAINRGPAKTNDSKATVLLCRSVGDEYAWEPHPSGLDGDSPR